MKTKNIEKNKNSSYLLNFINKVFFGSKEEDGFDVILQPNRKPDPRELKGTKLADCLSLVTCPTLS